MDPSGYRLFMGWISDLGSTQKSDLPQIQTLWLEELGFLCPELFHEPQGSYQKTSLLGMWGGVVLSFLSQGSF